MNKPVLTVFFALLLPLLGAVGAWAAPAAETAPPTESAQIESLNKELEELKREQARLQESGSQFSGQLQQAPDMVEQMRREIAALEKMDATPRLPKTLEAMEQAINLLDAQAKSLQVSLNDVMERIGEQQALPTLARDQVASAQKQINDLQDRLREAGDVTPSNPLASLKIQLLKQQLSNASLRRDNAQSRLEGYQKLLELYTVNRDLLMLRMGVITSTLDVLRAERDSLRQDSAEQEQVVADELHSDQSDKHRVVVAELEKNQRLARILYALSDEVTRTNDALAVAKQELQDLRYRFEMAQQQLELTQLHQQVDDYLVRQRQTLQAQIKAQQDADDFSQTISQSRLDQFKYDDQLQQVRTQTNRDQAIAKLVKKKKDPVEPERVDEVSMDLREILAARADLLSKLVEANAKYVVALTNLGLVLDEQLLERKRFFELLNQKLLWRRSSAPLGLQWLQDLPASALWFVSHSGWIQVAKTWLDGFIKPVFPLLGFALLAALLYWPRQRLLRRLEVLRSHLGNVMKDKFRYTAEALAITVVLAVPPSLLLMVLASPLLTHSEATVFVRSVGEAMMTIAFWVFMLEFVRAVCIQNGLAVAHFSWRPAAIAAMQRQWRLLYWQIPWAIAFSVVWAEGDEQQAGLLGRAAYLAMAVLFWLFVWRLLNPRTGILQQDDNHGLHWYQRWNRWLFWLAVVVPTGLLGLAFEGFNFTAMMVHVLIYQSIMAAFMIFVLDQVCMRWFAVQERKIALERALAKREAMKKAKENQEAAKSSGEIVPEVDLPTIDVATISEQNRALLKVLSYSAFVAAMWWIWQDALQAANIAGKIVLWHYSLDGGEGAPQIPVTLGTLLLTLIAIVLTFVGVKNLPGLIEVVVLQRFKMDTGIRFAVTTTARYIAMIGGVMVVSGMIGLDWSKLGWLVAALGVGLGFGLQEIFANFISGLIILYERPIRIGDTVTINNLSGTVSRIRMRATTIVDWDQKEVIIPNKTFVTSQFVNWTLSDSTTRLVVKVGVVYGSDTDLVTRTLLEIARANPMVKSDPMPTALFLSFGESDLQFELRVFIEQFNMRSVLLHELNTEINRRFNELKIEIAFPQLDLHVKDLPASFQGKNS